MSMSDSKPQVLVVDDNNAVRDMLTLVLRDAGYGVHPHGDLRSAYKALLVEEFALALVDLQLGSENGLDLLRRIKEEHSATEVIIVTGDVTVETAVEAMRLGAFEYITKPFDATDLLLMVERALEHRSMQRHVSELHANLDNRQSGLREHIVHESQAMRRVVERALSVAHSDASVLIEGDSGVGKEVVARLIHEHGRPGKPFVELNCAAIPDTLLESELFGHARGAFTDAVRERKGLIQEAHEGTFFLDEVSELSAPLQGKLLRVLEDGRVRPVGSNTQTTVSVRFIAAANRSLEKLVAGGLFREDLYYRLAVIPISIAPLRERPEDILELAVRFLQEFSTKYHQDERRFHPKVLERFLKHTWPGNVRELRNVVQRAVVLASGTEILPEHCVLPRVEQVDHPPTEAKQNEWSANSSRTEARGTTIVDREQLPSLLELEREHIRRVMSICGGNKSHAAGILGISRNTLWRKLRTFETETSQNGTNSVP